MANKHIAAARLASQAIAILVLIALLGCNDKNPIAPGPIPDPGPGPAPVSLTIGGTSTLQHPGESGQLIVTLALSDQTTKDVTADATWSAQLGVVAVSPGGAVTASRYGVEQIVARYDTLTAAASVRVAPSGAFLIRGRVSSMMGVPLPARVQFASRCGTMEMEADDLGMFWLPAEGESTIQVDMEGFISQRQSVLVEADGRVDVTLQAVELPGSLAGDYRLTVTASPSCAFPAGLFPRSYDARIAEISGELFVELSGANLVAWAGMTGFTGTREGASVQFLVRDTFDDGYNFIERIGPGSDLYYSGTARGVAVNHRIVTALTGRIAGAGAICEATDHRFELVPWESLAFSTASDNRRPAPRNSRR